MREFYVFTRTMSLKNSIFLINSIFFIAKGFDKKQK